MPNIKGEYPQPDKDRKPVGPRLKVKKDGITQEVDQVQRFTKEAFTDVKNVFEMFQITLGDDFLTNDIVHSCQIVIDSGNELNWVVIIEESFKHVFDEFFKVAPDEVYPVLYEVFCHRDLGIGGIETALHQSYDFLSLAREGELKPENLHKFKAFTLLNFSREYEEGRLVCTGMTVAKNIMTQVKKASLAVNSLLQDNSTYQPDAVYENGINVRQLAKVRERQRRHKEGGENFTRESIRNYFRREITSRTDPETISKFALQAKNSSES